MSVICYWVIGHDNYRDWNLVIELLRLPISRDYLFFHQYNKLNNLTRLLSKIRSKSKFSILNSHPDSYRDSILIPLSQIKYRTPFGINHVFQFQ
jgi:hypothetical protein